MLLITGTLRFVLGPRADTNIGDLVQREHPKIRVEQGWGQLLIRNRKPAIYLLSEARWNQDYSNG